ncbi:hypothetical protein AVEN_27365-1 [Araneus ventricosus]|uniref:Uncharacterized protein n=1 Tax=Araneus ventricosus TaxID=182803 RepID=A0A4Y2IPE4_ARAVE|nr:hypothetical protein AVEN_27365-1 [Araneus ventricosus]
MIIENALEADSETVTLQFLWTELKTRRQKPGESLQVLPPMCGRLMSLAYAECPQDVRDSLAASTLSMLSEMKILSTQQG